MKQNLQSEFKYCYPDFFTISNLIKYKCLEELAFQYIKLDKNIGYWIVESPFIDDGFEVFKNLLLQFPIQKDSRHSLSLEPNQFSCIHIPSWCSNNLCLLVKKFFDINIKKFYKDYQFGEWGNIFIRNELKPLECYLLPHFDYPLGLVSNLWLTDHSNDRGTNLFHYTGRIHGLYYDFQIDPNHTKYKEYTHLVKTKSRLSEWKNYTDQDYEKWGFIRVGIAPAKQSTLTLYESHLSHSPFISDKCEFSWSHTFSFSCSGGLL